jgi:hypothetical protein
MTETTTVATALKTLTARRPAGALLLVRELRGLCPGMGKADFDAAVLALRAARSVVLHHHDHAAHLSTEERDQLVCAVGAGRSLSGAPADVHYVGIVAR